MYQYSSYDVFKDLALDNLLPNTKILVSFEIKIGRISQEANISKVSREMEVSKKKVPSFLDQKVEKDDCFLTQLMWFFREEIQEKNYFDYLAFSHIIVSFRIRPSDFVKFSELGLTYRYYDLNIKSCIVKMVRREQGGRQFNFIKRGNGKSYWTLNPHIKFVSLTKKQYEEGLEVFALKKRKSLEESLEILRHNAFSVSKAMYESFEDIRSNEVYILHLQKQKNSIERIVKLEKARNEQENLVYQYEKMKAYLDTIQTEICCKHNELSSIVDGGLK